MPLGPINVLLGNIHFRDLSSVVTHFWEKRKSLDRSYFFVFCRATLLYACQKSQLEIPNVLNELISEIFPSFKILQLCGS